MTNEVTDMKCYLKVSNVATRTESFEWYSFLTLHAVVPLFSVSLLNVMLLILRIIQHYQ
jgi:hypothetical protein